MFFLLFSILLKLLEKCGFVDVTVEDCSDLYQKYCQKEIERAQNKRTNNDLVTIR